LVSISGSYLDVRSKARKKREACGRQWLSMVEPVKAMRGSLIILTEIPPPVVCFKQVIKKSRSDLERFDDAPVPVADGDSSLSDMMAEGRGLVEGFL
jgi:hypothetical protein